MNPIELMADHSHVVTQWRVAKRQRRRWSRRERMCRVIERNLAAEMKGLGIYVTVLKPQHKPKD